MTATVPSIAEGIRHWFGVFVLAAGCLLQEFRGEEPDCVPCWKCEMARVVLLSATTFALTCALRCIL